jgi:hypothetical protein
MLQVIKNLRIAFYLLFLLFILLFFFQHIAIIKNQEMIISLNNIPLALNYISILSVIISIPLTHYIYNVFSKKGKSLSELQYKLSLYKKVCYIRYIIIGSFTLLNLIFLHYYYDKQFEYILFILLIYFLYNFPSVNRFKLDFGIDTEQKNTP